MSLSDDLEQLSTLPDAYLVAFGHERSWKSHKLEIEQMILTGDLNQADTKIAELRVAYDKLKEEIVVEKELKAIEENQDQGTAIVNTAVASLVDFDGMTVGKIEKIIERLGNVLLLVSIGEVASAKRVLLEVKTDRNNFTKEMRDKIASRM